MENKKVNYFYIDESGNINNDSSIFIHGCILTDSPLTISETLKGLKNKMASDLYYEEFRKHILTKGFHATENNMDMRAELYKLLPLLNYRAYFVITKKDSAFFNDKIQNLDESEFFLHSLKKLLHDRIISHKSEKNIFYFENIQLRKKSLKQILEILFSQYDHYDIEYYIVGKEEENLAIVDYLNFIFFQLLTLKDGIPRMKKNFQLVSQKIGVVNYLHNNIFLSRKKNENYIVNLNNLIEKY